MVLNERSKDADGSVEVVVEVRLDDDIVPWALLDRP